MEAMLLPAETSHCWKVGQMRKKTNPTKMAEKAVTIGTKREPPKKPNTCGNWML